MNCQICTKKPARFKTKRKDGGYGYERHLCEACLKDKMGKYELDVTPLAGGGPK